jgi:hypothetical protein
MEANWRGVDLPQRKAFTTFSEVWAMASRVTEDALYRFQFGS